ncbi:MAG: hypothetical protein HRU15_09025, partial [Planctomycetes bacterium]|nr:hypothetical protein [Planctomycetota bacterium]
MSTQKTPRTPESDSAYKAEASYPFDEFVSPGFREMPGLAEDTTTEKSAPLIFLLGLLLVSGLAAGAMFIFDPAGMAKSVGGEREETEYEKRIKSSKLASKIAEELKDNITMPPVPPDPESVIEEAMTESMKNDVDTLMGGVDEMIETTMVKKIGERVAKAMEADIKLLSKDIAEGKLSAEEITKRQQQLEDKAHETMNTELREVRVETQTSRAEFESIKWYQDAVAPALLTTIAQQVFKGGERISPSFNTLFDGKYGWGKYRKWSRSISVKELQQLSKALSKAMNEQWNEKEWEKWKATWKIVEKRNAKQKNPRAKKVIPQIYYGSFAEWQLYQAQRSSQSITHIYQGSIRGNGTYPTPSWINIVYGITDEHTIEGKTHLPTVTNGVLNEFLIDQQGRHDDMLDQMTDDWEDVIEAAIEIEETAKAGATIAELHALREQKNAQLKAISKNISKLLKGSDGKNIDFKTRQKVNDLLRFRILADVDIQKEQHQKMIDGMVVGLAKLIKDFARSQFRKGILEDKDGIDAAVEKFQADIIPLMTSDLKKRVCSLRFFQEAVFNAGSHKKFNDILGDLHYAPGSTADVDKENKTLDALLEKHADLGNFVKLREIEIRKQYDEAVGNVVDDIIMKTLVGGWLAKNMSAFVEGVDYSDKVEEKLKARESAKEGRKQDMARMTKDGVPDTDLGMTALKIAGQKGHGANLQP